MLSLGLVSPPRGPAGQSWIDRTPWGGWTAGALFMLLFCISLGMGFSAVFVLFLIVHEPGDPWLPFGAPRLPVPLLAVTAVMVTASVTIQTASRVMRAGRARAAVALVCVTLVLGLAYMAMQATNWSLLVRLYANARHWPGVKLFYALTGLHALHVFGGVVALGYAIVRMLRGDYSAHFHPALRLTTWYWHFVDAVWLAMFVLFSLAA